MYYLTMKVLSKAQLNPTIAISTDRLYPKNRNKVLKFYKKKFPTFIYYYLIPVSLLVFLLFPESPQKSANICNKYYSEVVCNVW